MMTEKEIDESIKNDYIIPFYEKIYDAPLPPKIIENFSRAIRLLPPVESKLSTERWGKMIAKSVDEINMADIGILLNTISACPPYMIFETIEEQFEYMQKYEEIRRDYNKTVHEFEKKVIKIKTSKMQLSGVTRSVNYKSDLQIAQA